MLLLLPESLVILISPVFSVKDLVISVTQPFVVELALVLAEANVRVSSLIPMVDGTLVLTTA